MNDPYALDRFVNAQRNVYWQALAEIARGAKRGHWMWFIFPQYAGLGCSAMARTYAIGSIGEARAYLAHPVLGGRLRECVHTLQDLPTGSAEAVFGAVDARKLRSSLTLFDAASDDDQFAAAIDRWFGGIADRATRALLSESAKPL